MDILDRGRSESAFILPRPDREGAKHIPISSATSYSTVLIAPDCPAWR
jgi:hypothetical protein